MFWVFSLSRLPVGSSANMISLPEAKARAMVTRCCSPPESARGKRRRCCFVRPFTRF